MTTQQRCRAEPSPGGAGAEIHAGGVSERPHGGGHQHVRRGFRVGAVRRLPPPAHRRQLAAAPLAHEELQALQRVLRMRAALQSVHSADVVGLKWQ